MKRFFPRNFFAICLFLFLYNCFIPFLPIYFLKSLCLTTHYFWWVIQVRETIFTNARWLQSVNGVQGTPNVNIFPEGFLIRYKASGNGIVGKSARNQKRRSRKSLVRESLKKLYGKTIPSDDVKYLVKLYEEHSTPRQPAYVPEDQDYWNNWINKNEKERLFSILG